MYHVLIFSVEYLIYLLTQWQEKNYERKKKS